MQTVFVTGAEGFAGGHLLERLKERGINVIAGVRNRGRKLALERRHENVLVCDVSDAINVARAIASTRPDGVIHLAANAKPGDASSEPLEAYQSIVSGWANVLDAVRRTSPRARVLMVSSCDAYGNVGADGRALNEDMPLEPITTFGALKAAAESIAHTFHRNYHLDVTIARPFHHTGPGQSDAFYFGAVAKRIAEADGQPMELRLSDLHYARDVLHVKDVVEAYCRLLTDGKPDQTYNVCSGESRTCESLVQSMIRASGRNVTVTSVKTTPDLSGVACFRGDGGKLSNELGWRPTHTADEAMADLMRSYQNRQNAPSRNAAITN